MLVRKNCWCHICQISLTQTARNQKQNQNEWRKGSILRIFGEKVLTQNVDLLFLTFQKHPEEGCEVEVSEDDVAVAPNTDHRHARGGVLTRTLDKCLK